jgi:hypothetical protein
MRLGVRFYLLITIWIAVLTLALMVARPTHADEGYTADDTVAAIDEASAEIGVSRAWLYRTVDCETTGLDPYSIGRQGELGAAQLHPRGLLPKFYAVGYLDPFSPYQAIRFMAQEFKAGRSGAWTCS